MWREAETKSSGDAKTRFVHISEVDLIEYGQKTRKEFSNITSFLMGKKKVPLENLEANQCISITYGAKKESLLLIGLTSTEASIWVWGLKELQQKLKRGENLSQVKSLPYPLEYSQTANSSRSAMIPDTPASPDEVTKIILRISKFEEMLGKLSHIENQEIYNRCRKRLDNLITHVKESDTSSNPILQGDIKNWKIEFWKLDLDVGALELMSK